MYVCKPIKSSNLQTSDFINTIFVFVKILRITLTLHYVVEDNLELWPSLLHLLSAGISVHHLEWISSKKK